VARQEGVAASLLFQWRKLEHEIERRTLPLLKNPSRREKVFFALGVLVAGAAPWLTFLVER
jgi:transposase-like protein